MALSNTCMTLLFLQAGGSGPSATRTRAQQRAQQLRQNARDQRRGLVSDQPSTSTPQRRGGRGRGRGTRGGVQARLGYVQQTASSNVKLIRSAVILVYVLSSTLDIIIMLGN